MQSDVNFPLVLCKPTSQIIQPKFNQCKRFVLHPLFPFIHLTISILGSSTIFGLSLKYTLRFVPSTSTPGISPFLHYEKRRVMSGMVMMLPTVVMNVISVMSEGLRPYFRQNIVPKLATGIAMTTVLMSLT